MRAHCSSVRVYSPEDSSWSVGASLVDGSRTDRRAAWQHRAIA